MPVVAALRPKEDVSRSRLLSDYPYHYRLDVKCRHMYTLQLMVSRWALHLCTQKA